MSDAYPTFASIDSGVTVDPVMGDLQEDGTEHTDQDHVEHTDQDHVEHTDQDHVEYTDQDHVEYEVVEAS